MTRRGDFSTGHRLSPSLTADGGSPSKKANLSDPVAFVSQASTSDAMIVRGKELASVLTDAAVILLEGPLGAGKTTFARGLLQGFGVFDGVKSPSFDLVHRHQGTKRLVLHVDLYRLLPEEDAPDAGSELVPPPSELDADDEDALLVVEWGAPWAGWYRDRIEVGIDVGARAIRTVTVSPIGRWQSAPEIWHRLPEGWRGVYGPDVWQGGALQAGTHLTRDQHRKDGNPHD